MKAAFGLRAGLASPLADALFAAGLADFLAVLVEADFLVVAIACLS
jgi:hypothetical protein